MKEAKYVRMSEEEFTEIAMILTDVPQKESERQRDYFERLKRYGVNSSRATMQLIIAALKEEPDEMKKACMIYKTKIKNNNKRENKQQNNDNEPIPGQMEMELVETKPQDMTEQVKMMRFQAAQVDNILIKLETINDTLSQILRVVRKE